MYWNNIFTDELPEKLPGDDKCKIQYSNILDCPESQCEQFIKSMEECVNGV